MYSRAQLKEKLPKGVYKAIVKKLDILDREILDGRALHRLAKLGITDRIAMHEVVDKYWDMK